ncbi:MAG TPA: hypothetical protein VFX38_07380 [Gammaproteobacteria bacterium]|nr:hypothetical protein [Gammaproteobacteria bacterium]
MNTALVVDIAEFAGLFTISALVRSRFRHHGYSATAAGGIVMAIGIFADAALRELPFYSPTLARLITLEALVIWLFLAWSYLLAATNRHFRMHMQHPLRRFAIGTWVAGTAVLSVICVHYLPGAPLLGKTLALVAVVVYLPYVVLFVNGYLRLWRHPAKQNANGVILLATVSTQSVVIALDAAFGGGFATNIAIGMVAFDMIFLCSGLVLVAIHYHAVGSWFLAIEWKNANCILHGAISITGLALVLTSNFNADVLFGVWEVALVLFVAVESIEFLRMLERERRRGLRLGLLVYDSTQWTRNFTYGMFYAFSLALYHRTDFLQTATGAFWWPALDPIVRWGQYAVLAILLVEILLFLRARLHLFWRVGARITREV